MRSPLAVAFVTGLCTAQQPPPQDAPLDLASLAARLDPGEEPSVADVIPATAAKLTGEIVKKLSPAEADQVWAGRFEPMYGALCIDLLARPQPGAPAPVLLRELRACDRYSKLELRERLRQLLDPGKDGPAWLVELGRRAGPRARWLAAKVLREHPTSVEAADVLLLLAGSGIADDLDVPAQRLSSEGLRRRGEVERLHWLSHAAVCLRAADLAATAAALDAANAAAPAAATWQRRRDADHLFHLRRLSSLAREADRAALAEGTDGRVARLRKLLCCDPDDAVAEARTWVEGGEEQALPLVILAHDALQRGDRPAAEALSARALRAPGFDAHVAGIYVTVAGFQLAEDPDRFCERLDVLLAELDPVSADAAGETSLLVRAFRRLAVFASKGDVPSALPEIVELQRECPDSLSAYQLLIGCAASSKDAALAREVLLRPIPAALAGLPDLTILRAKAFLLCELRAGRAPDFAAIELVLDELQRVDGCEREAAYLRGVCKWWQANGPDRDENLLRAARDEFAGCDWGPGDEVWSHAVSARLVADASLGSAVDWDEVSRVLGLRHESDRGAYVPYLSQVFLTPRLPVERLRRFAERAAEIEGEAQRAVVYAALASAWSSRGDTEAAQQAAATALRAVAERSQVHLPQERGVLASGEFHWQFRFGKGGANLVVRVSADFWVVPVVPSVAELERIAGGTEPR